MPRHSPRPTAGRRKRLSLEDKAQHAPAVPVAPCDLTAAQHAVWDRLAPAAHGMKTLTPETVPGFRLLVETVVQRDQAWAILDAEGLVVVTPAGSRAHPISTHARQLSQRVESLMAKFALVAPGRAVERPHVDAPDELTKWERLTRRPDSDHDFYS